MAPLKTIRMECQILFPGKSKKKKKKYFNISSAEMFT